MKTVVSALRLRVGTGQETVGAEITFGPGFNAVVAPNNRGKSQITQAITFALGMERMFGPEHISQLGSAFTQLIAIPSVDGTELERPVAWSWCAVELKNEAGSSLTAQRFVKHPTISPELVRAWDLPVLTNDEHASTDPTEFFVHASGGYASDSGFAGKLARFLGWVLPNVPRYGNQTDAPLYPDVIYPFLYADQRSWQSAAPRRVSQYQLREPNRRATEFLLGLRGPTAAAERAALERELGVQLASWTSLRASMQASASGVGARVTGLPRTPNGSVTRTNRTSPVQATDLAEAQIEVAGVSGQFEPFDDVINQLRSSATVPRPILNLEDPLAAARLREAEARLRELTDAAVLLEQNLTLSEGQAAALERRVSGLNEERMRNQDVKTLRRLGAEAGTHLGDDQCPTCQQSLSEVEAAFLGPVLDLDESSALVSAQLTTAQGMLRQVEATAGQQRNALAALNREVDTARIVVRAGRNDATSGSDQPTEAAVAVAVTSQARLAEMIRVDATISNGLAALGDVANAVADLANQIEALPAGVPAEDTQRVAGVEAQMQTLLESYGFGSYAASAVELDEDTLRPERGGVSVDSDASASDVVRIKIAFMQALRSQALEAGGPHPGMLILDDPRQHDMNENDFKSIIRNLAGEHGVQTVITTSSPVALVQAAVVGASDVLIQDRGRQRLLQTDAPTHWMDRT